MSERARSGASANALDRLCRVLSRFYLTAGRWDADAEAGLFAHMRESRHQLGIGGRQKLPLTEDIVEELCRAPDDVSKLVRLRDDAILLLCFHAALSPQEFTALSVGDVAVTEDELILDVPALRGATVAKRLTFAGSDFPSLHVALAEWIQSRRLSTGPLFCSLSWRAKSERRRLGEDHLSDLLSRRLRSCGFDPTRFDSTSLFRGLVASKLAAGLSCEEISNWRGVPLCRIRRVRKTLASGVWSSEHASRDGT
ncbi:MAG TPA: hypothetical protein VMA86_01655 [Acetobacteraceae bacterium]|nr:hypothetical protein [Acetobacteraceae bacterium]